MSTGDTARDDRGHRTLIGAVAALGGGRVAGAAISALWLIVAARQLSLSAFGDLSVLLSIGAILVVVSDLGYPFLLSHAVAVAGAVSRRTLFHVVIRRLIVGLGAAGATVVLYTVVAGSDQPLVPILFGVSMLATVVHSSVNAALRGLGVYRVEAGNEVVSRLFVLAVGTLWLRSGGGLLAAVVVYVLADLGSLLAVLALARRRVVDRDDGIDLGELSLHRAAPLTLGRLMMTIYARADTWLMALLRGATDTALYSAPYRLLDGLLLLPRALGAVLVARGGTDRQQVSIKHLVGIVIAASTVVVLPIVAFATPIVTLLFGERYESSGPVLAVLAASAIPGAFVMVALPLVGVRAGRRFVQIAGMALVANIGGNLVVIPEFGPIGAAALTLACQLALAVALFPVFARCWAEPLSQPSREPLARP